MLDFGITVDYGQLLFSNDIIKMVRRGLQGIDVNRETLALDIIDKVGPAGNFIFEEHTMQHMRTEQAQPTLIDRRMRYAWEADGSKDLTTRAKEKAREILATYQPTPVAENIRQEVEDIVKKSGRRFASQRMIQNSSINNDSGIC